jgi:hypothetical protein
MSVCARFGKACLPEKHSFLGSSPMDSPPIDLEGHSLQRPPVRKVRWRVVQHCGHGCAQLPASTFSVAVARPRRLPRVDSWSQRRRAKCSGCVAGGGGGRGEDSGETGARPTCDTGTRLHGPPPLQPRSPWGPSRIHTIHRRILSIQQTPEAGWRVLLWSTWVASNSVDAHSL